MDLKKVLEKRASVKNFSDKKVKGEDIVAAVEAANVAPSPGNVQILKYIVVGDAETKEKIAEYCRQDFIKDAPVVVVVCSEDRDVKRFYDSRAGAYVKHHVGAAVENFLLKIVDLGLSACWVGAFSRGVRSLLKVPDNVTIEVILPVGYQAVKDKTVQKRKYSLNGRLFFEGWGNKYANGLEKVRRGDM